KWCHTQHTANTFYSVNWLTNYKQPIFVGITHSFLLAITSRKDCTISSLVGRCSGNSTKHLCIKSANSSVSPSWKSTALNRFPCMMAPFTSCWLAISQYGPLFWGKYVNNCFLFYSIFGKEEERRGRGEEDLFIRRLANRLYSNTPKLLLNNHLVNKVLHT